MDSSTFLTQVQEAEAKAAKMVSDAKLKAQKDLQDHSAHLQDKESAAEAETKTVMAEKITEAQGGAKKLYQELLDKGQQSADDLEKKCEQKLSGGVVAMGKEFLMSELAK